MLNKIILLATWFQCFPHSFEMINNATAENNGTDILKTNSSQIIALENNFLNINLLQSNLKQEINNVKL